MTSAAVRTGLSNTELHNPANRGRGRSLSDSLDWARHAWSPLVAIRAVHLKLGIVPWLWSTGANWRTPRHAFISLPYNCFFFVCFFFLQNYIPTIHHFIVSFIHLSDMLSIMPEPFYICRTLWQGPYTTWMYPQCGRKCIHRPLWYCGLNIAWGKKLNHNAITNFISIWREIYKFQHKRINYIQ